MAELKFITKGNIPPYGKSRVYFCCHPDDFEKYFEEITDDILEIVDCAIYYSEDKSSTASEDDLNNLLLMNLCVVPVTTNLLTKESRADKEIEFILNHKNQIHILPLLQESELVGELYQRKLGNLQFLYKNSRDLTEVPYSVKLYNFLYDVLVDSEYKKEIKSAFRGQMFLSYRKVNRHYAQELMSKIHEYEFQDVAIWYDEFLIPGEDFNEGINDAINESDLFTLLVTPEILGDNYVKNREYPQADGKNMKILAVEMEKTDKNKLKDDYKSVPDCLDLTTNWREIENVISKSLLKNESDKAVKYSYEEKDLYIALAYLYGICVEINKAKARHIIKNILGKDLQNFEGIHNPKIYERLSHIYKIGDGVEANIDTAINLQEKVVEYNPLRIKSWCDLGDLCYSLCELEHTNYYDEIYYSAIGNYENAIALVTEYNIVNKENYRYITRSYLALAALRRFDTKESLNKLKEYIIFYKYNRSQINELEPSEKIEMQKALSVCYEKSEEYYYALEVRREIFNEAKTSYEYRNLIMSYQSFGEKILAKGNFEVAKEYLETAVDESNVLVELEKNTENMREKSISYIKLGNFFLNEQNSNNIDQAADLYKEATEIRENICKKTKTIEARRDLVEAYRCLQSVKNEDIVDLQNEIIDILESIYNDTKTQQSIRDLSQSYRSLGEYLNKLNQKDGAEWFEKAEEIEKELK